MAFKSIFYTMYVNQSINHQLFIWIKLQLKISINQKCNRSKCIKLACSVELFPMHVPLNKSIECHLHYKRAESIVILITKFL